jgi:hypothetical protein
LLTVPVIITPTPGSEHVAGELPLTGRCLAYVHAGIGVIAIWESLREVTMTAAEVLAKHGTQRAAEVVELAAAAGLELAAAATLLEKESHGGRNVYGHDPVKTGGNYELGGPVTEGNFRKYKAHRKEFGAQGVGPTQLTFPGFQDRADDRGGCFDFRVNCLVGFEILADHITAKGIRDGFRAYNGSGAAAERYADDAMSKLAVWRSRLGGAESMILSPEEEDMTGEQAQQLEAIFKGLTVQGTTSPEQTVNELFNRIERIEAALIVPGTTSAEDAFNLLFARVREIHKKVVEEQ